MYRVTADSSSEIFNRMVPAPPGILAPLTDVINIDAMDPEAAALIQVPKKKKIRSEKSKEKRKLQNKEHKKLIRDEAKMGKQKTLLLV